VQLKDCEFDLPLIHQGIENLGPRREHSAVSGPLSNVSDSRRSSGYWWVSVPSLAAWPKCRRMRGPYECGTMPQCAKTRVYPVKRCTVGCRSPILPFCRGIPSFRSPRAAAVLVQSTNPRVGRDARGFLEDLWQTNLPDWPRSWSHRSDWLDLPEVSVWST